MKIHRHFLRLNFLFFIPVFIGLKIHAQDFQTGDLIFQAQGFSEMAEAISASTAANDSLKIIHVGIIVAEGNQPLVLEASPDEGVVLIPISVFLEKSPLINNNPGVLVKRFDLEYDITTSIERAKSHIGEDYDWWYLPDNGKMYCSELIEESFVDFDGEKIIKTIPMNFRSPDGSMLQFWIDLFSKLNMEVPEGLPGTNPNDISKDSRLIEIYRYF